jgi:phenylacetate-CoA ligase
MQEKKLKAIIRYAYDNSPFYQRYFKENGVNPNDIKTLKDIEKIPTIGRKDIQRNLNQMASVEVNVKKCSKLKTSGSTGIPLTILVDKNAQFFRWVVSLRQFFECGGRLRDKQLQLRNIDDVPSSRNSLLAEMVGLPKSIFIPINKIPLEEIISIIRTSKPEVIVGYPSFLQILSENIHERIDTRVIFVTGEILSNHCHAMIQSIFGRNIIDSYGCMEVGDIAWECPDEHASYHINADSVFVEFLRDGENVAPGEEGEIVLTGLFNCAMPFIRYRIGDIGVPSDEQCPCGRTLPLMHSLKGRSDDFIVLPEGKKISPLGLLNNLKITNEISEFRVIQRSKNLIEFWLKAQGKFVDKNVVDLISSLRSVVGKDVEIKTRIVSEIPRDKSKKLRRIISEA